MAWRYDRATPSSIITLPCCLRASLPRSQIALQHPGADIVCHPLSTLVVANNLSGTVSIVKTAASAYPKAPTKIAVKSSSSKSATISWKKSKSSGVTGYVVTALPGGKTCSTKKTTCTIQKLSGGTKHTFAVQTTSKYGARVPRNSSTVTVKT